MTLNLVMPMHVRDDFVQRIVVIGVGGGGTNAVDNMIALNLQGVEFVVANTDAQQLQHSRADRRVQLGPRLTQGLGAGARPEIGRAAAEEVSDELMRHLEGAHMVFITAGMGGGTGTGAAPVIARMARERGVLTVGVVTKPFAFEGTRRAKAAETGITELQQFVDTLIVIPNQNLFRIASEKTGWKEAFKMADHVLYMGVRGVTDLMVAPGLVNLDFADIRTVMAEMGKAMMGTGEAEGENRATRAAEAAISNPLLEDTSMGGARGLLINITGGDDMTLFEVDQAANRIREEVAEDANIIFGSAIDETLAGRVRVSVVATGIDLAQAETQKPRLVAVGGGTAHAVFPSLAPTQLFPSREPATMLRSNAATFEPLHTSLPSVVPRQPTTQPNATRSLFDIMTGLGRDRRGVMPNADPQRAKPLLPNQASALSASWPVSDIEDETHSEDIELSPSKVMELLNRDQGKLLDNVSESENYVLHEHVDLGITEKGLRWENDINPELVMEHLYDHSGENHINYSKNNPKIVERYRDAILKKLRKIKMD